MNLLEEFKNIKKKLGEDWEYKEYLIIEKYLEENPNLLLADLFFKKENMDRFEEWKFNDYIKHKKIFATIYKDNKMQIDYLNVEQYRFGYKSGTYLYDRDQLFLTLDEAKKSLKTYKPGYVYTNNTEKYIKSIKQDKEELIKEYYGKSKLNQLWFKEVDELNKNNNIDKIYEVYTKGFLGAWYLIKDKNENRYIVKHKTNDVNTKFMMNPFLDNNECERIESQEINITKYDTKSKQQYNQMIFDYVIDFKNNVEENYFKLNLNQIDIVEKFLEDYSNEIELRTKIYIKDNLLLKDNKNLQECFITHVKFDVKCRIKDELNSLNFSKNNWYINSDNIEDFINEFTKKAIYGEVEEEEENAK